MKVPPGGFAGFAQHASAARNALSKGLRSAGGGRRRRRKSKKAKARKTAKRAVKSVAKKLKFGSPAWQKKYKVGAYSA